MTEYVKNLIIIGVAASLAVASLPKNAESSGKYVRQLSSFMILAVLLSPLGRLSELVSAVRDGIDGIGISGSSAESEYTADAVIGESAEVICKYVIRLCAERYGFDEEETVVRLILDDRDVENVTVSEIQVFTPESDGKVLSEAAEHLTETFGCKAFVFGGAAEKQDKDNVPTESGEKERE